MYFSIYAELINRQQTHIQLVVFDLTAFVAISSGVHETAQLSSMDVNDTPTSQLQNAWIVWEEISETWINVSFPSVFM